MIFQLVVVGLAVLHAAAPQGFGDDEHEHHHKHHEDHHEKHHEEHHEEHHEPHYKFEYEVKDKHTGDYKNHRESRKGDDVEGYYSVLEPDGTLREVHYTSAKHAGFNAVVTKSGKPIEEHHHEEPEHHHEEPKHHYEHHETKHHHEEPKHHYEHHETKHHHEEPKHHYEHHETKHHHEEPKVHYHVLDHHEEIKHHEPKHHHYHHEEPEHHHEHHEEVKHHEPKYHHHEHHEHGDFGSSNSPVPSKLKFQPKKKQQRAIRPYSVYENAQRRSFPDWL